MNNATSNPRTLEVTVLSAENILHQNRKPTTKNVFVVVRAESITGHTTALSSGEHGNGYHSWNEKFTVELAPHARSIAFEVKCKTSSGVKDIGVARIALSDFLGGMVPDTFLQFLSYRLRDVDGQRNGIINFSVRVMVPPLMLAEKGSSSDQCGVVTGIPCYWLNNQTGHV